MWSRGIEWNKKAPWLTSTCWKSFMTSLAGESPISLLYPLLVWWICLTRSDSVWFNNTQFFVGRLTNTHSLEGRCYAAPSPVATHEHTLNRHPWYTASMFCISFSVTRVISCISDDYRFCSNSPVSAWGSSTWRPVSSPLSVCSVW